jgi:hypothetical protein
MQPIKGQRWIAYADRRPAERVFIYVTRVARDGSWADIQCHTWAVMWAKRQPLCGGVLPGGAVQRHWNQSDLAEQERDHMAKLYGRASSPCSR